MDVLYHASANPDLELLEPQRTISKDKYIGDYVFATKDKALAAMYLTPKGYGSVMESDKNPPRLLIRADEAEIRLKDTGGAIYKVDAANFIDSPQQELSAYEMVATKPIRLVSKETFSSVFSAWDQLGIKVEYIDQKTFDQHANKNT